MPYKNNMELTELKLYINNIARCLELADLLFVHQNMNSD